MSDGKPVNIAGIYTHFNAPIAALDCGDRCAPYNEGGVPFCCDPRHMVPTAYLDEWNYLQANTDLWRQWKSDEPGETERLRGETPTRQTLIVCQGHTLCQRSFRSITCRSFPFFPYINEGEEFLGLSYYWEYADRCWVISNLQVVSLEYRDQFIAAYDRLFELKPDEIESFSGYSEHMRREFIRRRRTIPLLHRDGSFYKISPANGRMQRVDPENMPKFGPYRVAAWLPFPGE